MFTNGLGDLGSIPGQVIPKIKKNLTWCCLLSIIRYESRVKWSNPGKGVAPSFTHWYSSYWNRSLRVTLDYGHQLYFTYNPQIIIQLQNINSFIFKCIVHSVRIQLAIQSPTLVCPCVGVHKEMLLMSSSLFLQQCSVYLTCLTWIICKMGGKWQYNCCFVGCCFQDLCMQHPCVVPI